MNKARNLEPEDRLRVALFSRQRELFSGPLENGRMVFDEIDPGLYTVTICNIGKVIGEIDLNLEECVVGGLRGN